MHSILYRSLNSGQLYIYDIDNKPISKVRMVKYYLEDQQKNSGNKLINIFILFILQEDFKPSKDMNYFIKIPCSSFSYCFLNLHEYTYKKDTKYCVNARFFNSIKDFLYLQKS